MQMMIKRMILASAAAGILMFAAVASNAQHSHVKRIHAPKTVHETIGGEAHDSYVIKVKKHKKLSIEISWKKEGGNNAEFTVSQSPDFGGGQVDFGRSGHNGREWTGKVPSTGDYYIYVVAHPQAKYKLRVTVK